MFWKHNMVELFETEGLSILIESQNIIIEKVLVSI